MIGSQSLTSPPELFSIASSDGGDAKQLTFFNSKRLANTALGRVEEMLFPGAKGEEVQSWLVRPAGFTAEAEAAAAGAATSASKFPLAVIVHGGPQGSIYDSWQYRWNLQSYASAGFAVLAVNFHGSTGFGHAFCREISGNWEVGGLDVVAGVQAALATHGAWIDDTRVVGAGASYGGFTANWLNGNAPEGMFSALVCHCGGCTLPAHSGTTTPPHHHTLAPPHHRTTAPPHHRTTSIPYPYPRHI